MIDRVVGDPSEVRVNGHRRKGRCRYVGSCSRYSDRDWFCSHQAGFHGVDLTSQCYREIKIEMGWRVESSTPPQVLVYLQNDMGGDAVQKAEIVERRRLFSARGLNLNIEECS